MPLTEEQRHKILRRGVARIIPEDEFVERLEEGRPLRLKMGFDPSAPDIHLGHAVGLRKLRQLQDLGHKVVIIVGDWTAQIGDPSGRSATRPMLTHAQVVENAETYLAQFFKIVDRDRAEVRWQSDWFGPFSLADVIRLTSKFTVAQFLQRDDFATRFRANHPIAITELLYPLLQAYDSVVIESDVEFGGTDQMFNLLVGRDLQEMEGQRPQQCFLMPLLPGTDGVQKMSKSLGNYIGIDEPPREIFGKTMSLPDTMIAPYFENLTDVSETDLAEITSAITSGSANLMDLKKRLGHELVVQFHGRPSAHEARGFFERTVQGGEAPEEIPTLVVAGQDAGAKRLSDLILDAGLARSSGEARRLIDQGAVRLDGARSRENVSGPASETARGVGHSAQGGASALSEASDRLFLSLLSRALFLNPGSKFP